MRCKLAVTVFALCISAQRIAAADENATRRKDGSPSRDLALEPATIIVNPWKQHVPPTKRQGVPGIERTAKGRLWTVYGRDVESTRNYQVLRKSDNDGRSYLRNDPGRDHQQAQRNLG